MIPLYTTVGTCSSTYLNDSSRGTYSTVTTETSAVSDHNFSVESDFNRAVAQVCCDAEMERALAAIASCLVMALFLAGICGPLRDEVVLFRISDRRPTRPRNTWD